MPRAKRYGIIRLLLKLTKIFIAITCLSSAALSDTLPRSQESALEKSIGQEVGSLSDVTSQTQSLKNPDNQGSTDLDILIETEPGRPFEIDGERKLLFADVCPQFGNLLVKNRGLWGTGPFQNYICSKRKSSQRNGYKWRLRISEKDGLSIFKIYYVDPTNRKAFVQSSYAINAKIGPLKILSNERYAQLIAAYLNLKLLFNGALPVKDLTDGEPITLQGALQPDIVFTRGDLKFFKMTRENKIWKPLILGYGNQIVGEGEDTKWKIKLKSEPLEISRNDISPKFVLFRYTSEKKETLKKIDEILQQEISRDVNKLLASIRSAYIGTRYAIPIGGGDGVLAVTPMVGVLGEFRAGALNGLRLYFDSRPKKEILLNNYSEEFSLSRIQVGYGFGKILNSSMINWIDMMPKIGVTSINLAVAVNNDLDLQKYDFQLDNAPVIGFELGVERRAETVTARLWLYGNFSLGVREIEKESKSTSYRLGLDLYKDLFSFSMYKTSMLFFVSFENTNFKNKPRANRIQQSSSIEELSYNSLFLGGGLAFSW